MNFTLPVPETLRPEPYATGSPAADGRGKGQSFDLDLVIPALNEELRIGPTLRSLSEVLQSSPLRVRVIVVDNGSVDATADEAVRALGPGVGLRVISCATRGKGAAVRAGVAAATAPYVGYIDADQSTPPESVLTAMGVLQSGFDAVIGSRRALGARYVVPQSRLRRLGSQAFNALATSVVGPVSDTQCGMKLFRTEAVRDVFAAMRIEGFAFDVELLARLLAADLRIIEVPVAWSDNGGSSFRPVRDGSRAFRELLTARRAVQRLR